MAMKFPAKGGEDFKRVPAGAHLAICNLVVDVGIQPGSGLYPDPKQKVYLRFETPNELVTYEKDGHKVEGPLTIGKFYTASMSSKANLRKDLEGWRSRKFTDEEAADFDISAILGKACMISVTETERDGKTYANIAGISALPKGMTATKAENPLLFYNEEDQSQFDKLPEWLRDKIANQIPPPPTAPEIDEHLAGHAPSGGDMGDEIPF